jgi:GxxExxY protein
MNRLLNGDVGSGKTVVAAIAVLQVMTAGYQIAIMAPTEVLSKQHFETFYKLFAGYNFDIALLTNSYKLACHPEPCLAGRQVAEGSNANSELDSSAPRSLSRLWRGSSRNDKKTRDSLLKKIGSNEINLVIGTHAIIQKDVKFKNLALVIVDEQHRFGVIQRAALQHAVQTDTDLTQTDAELIYEELTYKVRGCFFAIKKELGLGHKEIIYQRALSEELRKNNISFKKEVSIDINYNNKKVGIYRPDFIIDNKVIVELKALPLIGKFEKQQIWHYLKGSDYKLALLVNFGRDDIQIERFINTGQHKSASSPRKSVSVPHLLTMTATPIPRTLAIAFSGSLDISILDEMPKDRKKIITKIVPPEGRQEIYNFIRAEVKTGRQAFVILPLIEESKVLTELKAVKTEYEKLVKIFPEFKIGLLHGKMKSREKELVMQEFSAQGGSALGRKDKKLDILVSTSVVEVGIDIPNATVMIIEDAERFGLSQLHQFRGRVGRGEHQSFCFLFTGSSGEIAINRLKALVETDDGFTIAQKDLELRGPGQFFGTIQSGLPDISMENLSNVKLIKFSQEEARQLLQEDPELKKHPATRDALAKFNAKIHLE